METYQCYTVTIRPDIVLIKGNDSGVLDTKWKYLGGSNPSPDDLRQMFVYHKYFAANRVALVYPGESSAQEGAYFADDSQLSGDECSILPLSLMTNMDEWQQSIYRQCEELLSKPS